MTCRTVSWVLIVAALIASSASAAPAPAAPLSSSDSAQAAGLLAALRESARARDSLTVLADSAAGESRELLEELLWQRHEELQARLESVVDWIADRTRRGRDVSATRRALEETVRRQWPRSLDQLERRRRAWVALGRASDAASGAERLAIESRSTRELDRLLQSYRTLVDAVVALEEIQVDVAKPREFMVQGLRTASGALVTRLRLAHREQTGAAARLSRDAGNAELRHAFEAAEERLKRSSLALSTAIQLMDRLGLDSNDLRVARIATTGKITADVFRMEVMLGLLRELWSRVIEFLAGKAPQWIFQGLLIVLTFLGFRALSGVARGLLRRVVQHASMSQLMRTTIVRVTGHAILLTGYVVILTQLGVQVAPLLAGLGIAGFVVGFAMQKTLSNFAAGAMILGNQPFDVGDDIEVAGVAGIVKKMSLVSTTILTPDNQTLIIPNSTVWDGVIRNRTAEAHRRVDLTFSIGYGDDVEQAERVLQEIVSAQPGILSDPEPIIRLHQLADSSVIFVVRVWTAQARYWDIYWGLTRDVKLRFDREGITIPYPQRELHVNMIGPRAGDPVTALEARGRDPGAGPA